MLIFGHTKSSDMVDRTGAEPAPFFSTDAVADRVYTSAATAPSDCLVSKLTVALDGSGASNGNQVLRPVIYSSTGVLLGYGPAVEVANLAPFAWLDLTFDAPVAVTEGTVHIGVHAGPQSTGTRLYRTDTGSNLSTVTDTYNNGAAASGFTPSNSTGELGVFATYAYPWTPPDEDDDYLSNLGFYSAQAALGTIGDPRTKRRVYATWHGTFLDPEPQGASLAIVQQGGPLSDLVGERLRITAGYKEAVTVYVHRETDLDLGDDTQISLSRRAWQALAPLAKDTLLVTLATIGGEDPSV